MKFSDGYWLTRPGIQVHSAAAVDGTEPLAGGGLRVFAPTRVIRHRGDTLDAPLLTVDVTSPAADVIGVRLTHHAGGVGGHPRFQLNGVDAVAGESPSQATGWSGPEFTRGDDTAVVTAGGLSAHIGLGDAWSLEFRGEGRLLTASGWRSAAHVAGVDGQSWMREQLTLEPGTLVYGLGERFGPFVKNGQSVDIWNEDGGTATEQAYKNVPFYLTNHGYGVFVNDPGRVSFEVGSEIASRTQFSVSGETLEYFVIYGPTPKEILNKYTALTGRPARVPDWSYGLWLSTSFTTNYDETTVAGFIDGMAERDLPLSVFHFDCFWMRQFHWCDFVWDPAVFPDPDGMLARLRQRGLRVSVWINPYIAQRSHLFEEGRRLGFLVRRADGSVWQWDRWQAGMALVDFTNPDARAWFAGKLETLLDQGVDTFKTDFGERIPTDVVWHDGGDPERMHNYYSQLYNETVFDVLERRRGVGDAVVFARSATAGGQRLPVHWGGDCESTFSAMAESLRGGLSLASCGFGYWSHDIGGFEGKPDPDLFKRWVAFGLLSSHSRLHGSTSVRVPWSVDEESSDVLRTFTRLKMRLMPYLAAAGEEAHTSGVPVMRPMVVEFPDDPNTHSLDRQYMLGSDLLVAPVLTADGSVSFYLPEGVWTHLQTGAELVGGRWHTRTFGYQEAAVFVRPGAVLPIGAVDATPEYAWSDAITLRAYRLEEGAETHVSVPVRVTADGGAGAAAGVAEILVRRTGDTTEAEVLSGTATVVAVHDGGAL